MRLTHDANDGGSAITGRMALHVASAILIEGLPIAIELFQQVTRCEVPSVTVYSRSVIARP